MPSPYFFKVVKGKNNWFQALRYEEEGEKLIVHGPIAGPRNVHDEMTFSVAVEDAFPALCTPVVCHGLDDTLAHLNGKIGDIRSRGEDSDCYLVYFENEELDPQPVQAKFLRILFELPEKE